MESEDKVENQEIEEEVPVEISPEDAEKFKAVIEDLRKNVEKFREKTESANAAPVSAKGSFRKRSAAVRTESPEQESKIASLKERVKDAESKNDRLRKKNTELGNELAKAKSRLEGLVDEVNSLSKENEALKKRNHELMDIPKASVEAMERCSLLESENSMIRAELERLRKEHSTLQDEIDMLREEASENIYSLKSRISDQEDVIRKLKAGIPLSEIAGSVERTSSTQFSSDLFDSPRYDVRMARNGSYMTFKSDVQGKVPCSEGVLSIPSLPELIGFEGPRRYDAYHFNGGLKVVLR